MIILTPQIDNNKSFLVFIFPLFISEIQGSNLGPETRYLTEVYGGFLQSLQENARILP
jgi:hypothetical protein